MLKTEVHYGEMLAMNVQNFCQAHIQGSCTLAVAIFVLLFFLMVSSELFVTQVPL